MNENFNQPRTVPTNENLTNLEREFHRKRWEALAEAQRGMFSFRQTDERVSAVIEEEAIRDDVDFEKRQSIEFNAWQGNLQVVINNFKERAANPEKRDIRTLILFMGGGKKCGYGGGQAMGFNDIGLTADKVDAVVGASGGAVVATAYVAGPKQTKLATELMAGPMSTPDFIDPSIKGFKDSRVINLDKLGEAMSEPGGHYALDEKSIRNADTELWYTVTFPTEGDENPPVDFLNSKEVPSITEAIKASMSLHPRLTGSAGTINGVEYRDGAINPLPIEEIINKFKPTDILILPQMPYENLVDLKPSNKEWATAKIAKLIGFNTVAKGLVSKHELRKALEQVQKIHSLNIGIMWPPDSGLDTLTTDSDQFKAGVIASYKDTLRQFGNNGPGTLPFLDDSDLPSDEVDKTAYQEELV